MQIVRYKAYTLVPQIMKLPEMFHRALVDRGPCVC